MSTAAQIRSALSREQFLFTFDFVDSTPASLKGWYALWVVYPAMIVPTCFYVGASPTDIRGRLLVHVRSSDVYCVKSMVYAYPDSLYFSYATKDPLDDVFGIEAQLITSMMPKCNDVPDPRLSTQTT